MEKKQIAGSALIVAAVLILVNNLSNQLAELKDWHDASTTVFSPAFVASSLQQLTMLISGSVGSNLLPTIGSKSGENL